MSGVGMGGMNNFSQQGLKETKQTDKNNKTEVKDKTSETMAGALQSEKKVKKEEGVKKSAKRFQAFKKSILGEAPDDGIDDQLKSKDAEKTKKTEEVVPWQLKQSMDLIDEYRTRERFKLKVKYLVGDDVDMDDPFAESEDEEQSEEQIEAEKLTKLELAQQSFAMLFEYIYETLGHFNFDDISDLKLLQDNGMPEEATVRLLIFHQLSRAKDDFPNQMDLSIILYKLEKLGVNISLSDLKNQISKEYGTLAKLKYTIAGFIYIPLPQVMDLVIKELNKKLEIHFNEITNSFGFQEEVSLNKRLPKVLLKTFREIILNNQDKLLTLVKGNIEKLNLLKTVKLNQKETLEIDINNIEKEISNINNELINLETIITKYIITYSYLTSGLELSDYNREFPIEMINHTLSLLKMRINNSNILELTSKKMNIHFLKKSEGLKKVNKSTSIDLFNLKVRGSDIFLQKTKPPQLQKIIKGLRENNFQISEKLYWLKQKKLNQFLSLSEKLYKEVNNV